MMKKLIIAVLAAALMLSGCGGKKTTHVELSPAPDVEAEIIVEQPEEKPDEPVVIVPEQPSIILEGYDAQQVTDYFCEVVLASEYSFGDGDSKALQKWKNTIYYKVSGEPTAEDMLVLENFARQLNEIPGFPGFFPAEDKAPNFSISFLGREEHLEAVSHYISEQDTHGVTIWDYYNDSNEIYNVRIWIRTDLGQEIRNSVILEEIVNSLGMGNDTNLRPDSIIYQGYSTPQELTEMDWLLMRLLYSEEIKCGMYERQCREIIAELYK